MGNPRDLSSADETSIKILPSSPSGRRRQTRGVMEQQGKALSCNHIGIKNRKKQRTGFTSFCFLRFVFLEPSLRITFRDAHQKQLTSYDLWHDGWPIRGGRSLLPFSHGNRACLRDGDCGAEMFFSLLYTILFYYLFNILGCKSTHFF